MPIPMMAKIIESTAMTTANITTATIAITKAFIHPQSKKCLINANQTINNIIVAIKLPINAPTTVFIMVPRKTIQRASVNFALPFPAINLPEIQRAGERNIVPITICIIIPIKSMIKPPTKFDIGLNKFKYNHGSGDIKLVQQLQNMG